MDEPPFDFEAVFDDDYLHFYEGRLSPDQSDEDADLIWRLLGLETDLEVLDLACGHGRIANRLARRGCRVTGLDATPLFLERARRDAEELGAEVAYVEGDMRSLPWSEETFDRVVNWFTSFGYFPDPDLRRVLAEAQRVLKPGGRLLIENNNRDRILCNLQPEGVTERGDDFLIDRREFDPASSRFLNERIVIRGGKVRRSRYFVRMFTPAELRDWLLEAGFAAVEVYGEDGAPIGLESRRMLTVARR